MEGWTFLLNAVVCAGAALVFLTIVAHAAQTAQQHLDALAERERRAFVTRNALDAALQPAAPTAAAQDEA